MFTYLLQKAILKGYILKDEFQPVVNADGFVNLLDCSSIGVKGSYEEYISQPREISTFAAYGSFIIGTGIVEEYMRSSK